MKITKYFALIILLTSVLIPAVSFSAVGLSISRDSISLNVGESTTLQALYDNCPTGAQCFLGPQAVRATWSSSNPQVATVGFKSNCATELHCSDYDYKTIVVKAISSGTVTISAMYSEGLERGGFTASIPITVQAGSLTPQTISITTPSPLYPAVAGEYYSTNIYATGGSESYAWVLKSGTLPSGLEFSTNKDNIGTCPTAPCQLPATIWGTPTASGNYEFVLQVNSGTVVASKTFNLQVSSKGEPASVTISNAGELRSIVPGSSQATIGKFIFKSNDQDVTLISLEVKINDPSNKFVTLSDFGNISLYESGQLLSTVPGFMDESYGSGVNGAIFTFGGITIPKGLTKTFEIKADVSKTISSSSIELLVPANWGVGSNQKLTYTNQFPVYSSVVSFTGNESNEDAKPIGWIDAIKDGYIYGWAYDPDDSSASIKVHVYFDGPAGKSKNSVSDVANIERSDVNQVFEIEGSHGFQIPIPGTLQDGKVHNAYVYGIDLTSEKYNSALYGSPRKFSVLNKKTVENKRHARGTVVIGENATVFFLGSDVRYPFPSPEVFFSWGHNFSELVKASEADLEMPVGPMAELKK